MPSNPHTRASWSSASATGTLPYLIPARLPGSRRGAFVIDSVPPATTISLYPNATCAAAWAIAASPDRHSLLTVIAGTPIGMPPATAPSRAAFGPTPAWMTLPKITAST
jgi:hypothetical protein